MSDTDAAKILSSTVAVTARTIVVVVIAMPGASGPVDFGDVSQWSPILLRQAFG